MTFDGLQLSVGELRKKIMTLKKLGVSDDFTLQIMDAQSRKSQLRTLPYNWRGRVSVTVKSDEVVRGTCM